MTARIRKRMPRVLMFCGLFHPIVGGAERQAERLGHALLEQGCAVEVLTPRLEPDWPLEDRVSDLTVHRFPLMDLTRTPHFKPRGLGVPNTLIQRRQVMRAVAKRLPGFDLLHTHLASPAVEAAMTAAHRKGVPVLCKIACGGTGFDLPAVSGTSLLGPYFVRRLVRRMDRWIAISEEIRSDLRGAGVPDERIVSIPNGIDIDTLPWAPPRPPFRNLLYLGRLEKCDTATLVAAFDRLLESHPEARLRVVGRGPQEPVRAALSQHSRAAERTEVTGLRPALPEYQWAHVLVQPTLAEGISNSLLEAMSLGLPCIASDIPPNRGLLDDGRAGLLPPLHDAMSLAGAMRTALDEPARALERAEAARKLVAERYAIGVVARRYLDLYASLSGIAPTRNEPDHDHAA